MNGHSLALALLAVAVPLWSRARVAGMRLAELSGRPPPGARLRSRFSGVPPPRLLVGASVGSVIAVTVGWPYGPPLGVATGAAGWWLAGRAARAADDADPLGVAAAWDLLAACLRAGLPVPTAVTAIAGDLPAEAGRALRSAADLLALGADPVVAWAPAMACRHTAALARGARRTARSGTALAELVTELAAGVRAGAADAAESTAQRAGVVITAPLGLCFLPAFVCLGVLPVVAGLAGQLSI